MNPKQNHHLTKVEANEIELDDLKLTDTGSDAVKGGEGVCHGVTVLAWARVNGVS